MIYAVIIMTRSAQKDFEKCSIDGLYRLLNITVDRAWTISQLAPTFGHSRAQARKYVKLALGLGLVRGEPHEREFDDRPRRLDGWQRIPIDQIRYRKGFDRYYSTTRRGERVSEWLRKYATGKPEYRYPDPPLLRGSTRRKPRFPDRR
jgi:hypothetical protein